MWKLISLSSLMLIGFAYCPTHGGFFDWTPEWCMSFWNNPNLEDLQNDLERSIFGQPFVLSELLNSLSNHLSRPQPQKPLTLSFHGPPGTGKNYVVSFIVKYLYRLGIKSKFVHYFNGRSSFRRAEYIESYKSELHSWLRGNISSCGESLFIFDEVDKMPPGLFDSIKPLLDYQQFLKDADSRKSIFIFLSNIGGDKIKEMTIDLLQRGVKRKDFNLSTFQKLLQELALEQGGFEESSLLNSNLIDLFIPFLPLEASHVEECIRYELRKQSLLGTNAKSVIQSVMEEINFEKIGDIKLSASGCRHISVPISLHLRRRRIEL